MKRSVCGSTGDRVSDAVSRNRPVPIIGPSVIAIVIVAVLVVLRPAAAEEPIADDSLVTYHCTDLAAQSLRARADIVDDGGNWVTRRGFQYAKDGRGDPPDMISLVNPSFEYGDPLVAWCYMGGSGERTDEKAKVGSHSVEFTVEENEYGSVLQTNPVQPEQVAERTVTFGAWVWSDAPDRVRLYATYWVGESRSDRMSFHHPGDGNWHWLTLTVSFPAGVTAWNWRAINVSLGPVTTVYADGFCAVWGDELGVVFDDGEFGTGTYTLALTGLEPDTVYAIRAFAVTEARVSYGGVVTGKTP